VTLKALILDLLRFTQLSHAGVHALGHVLILGVLWLRDIQKLESELANPVRRAANDTSTLTLDTACPRVIYRPFVEARNINIERTTIGLVLMVLETHVSTCERTIRSDQIVEQIPGCRLVVTLGLCLLLLLLGQAVGLFLLLALLLLPLLR
jgi:hypothetical protein